MKGFLALIATMLFAAPAFAVSNFTLPVMNGDGGTYSTTDRGASYLLDFYFNTCPACNENADNVEEVAVEFHGPQTQVLAIGIDRNDSDYASWIRKHNPSFPLLKDSVRTVVGELGVSAYPTAVILDCTMTEVLRVVGVWSNAKKQQIKDKLFELQFQACD